MDALLHLTRIRSTPTYAAGTGLELDLGWCAIAERLMQSLVVVEGQIPREAHSRLLWASIVIGIHLLILDRTPQPFHEDIVERSALAIHADLHVGGEQQLPVLRVGEM